MGKAGRWLRSILGKKDGVSRGGRAEKALPLPQPQPQADLTPLRATRTPTPRVKKRWSFRRPAAAAAAAAPSLPEGNSPAAPPLSQDPSLGAGLGQSVSGRELDEPSERGAVEADIAVMAAAQPVARLTTEAAEEEETGVLASWLVQEEAAAARIQATFRGYLARKALCALRGLVKLQALVRGQLVRRQANATLRRMQALVSAQSRLRAQRSRMLLEDHQEEDRPATAAAAQRRSPHHPRRRSSYEMGDRSGGDDEHVKIVEMDVGGGGDHPARRGRSSCSAVAGESSRDRRLAEFCYHYGGQTSPPSSAAPFADLSPRTYSGHLDDLLAFDLAAADAVVPSYMANTESSRAKQARSQSAPRQRGADALALLERQPSRRRGGGGGATVVRKTMQRSSSHIGYQYQYPAWAAGVTRLDRSSASLVGSECGSTSSVLTSATVGGYCRSLVGFEVHNRAHY